MARKYAQDKSNFCPLCKPSYCVGFDSNAMISLGGVALYKEYGQSDTTDRQTDRVISIGVGGGEN